MSTITQPKGSMEPKIYFITGLPTEKDIQSGVPFSNDFGNYVFDMLAKIDMQFDARFINTSLTEDNKFDISVVEKDLSSLNKLPEVIISDSLQFISYITNKPFHSLNRIFGSILDATINNKNYKVIPVIPVKDIMDDIAKEESDLSTGKKAKHKATLPNRFLDQLKTAKSIIDKTYFNLLDTKTMDYCLTFQSFLDTYLDKGYAYEDKLAYDIETTAAPLWDKELKIIGFSNAKKDSGYYVCMDALDYHMTEEDKSKTKELLLDILKTQKTIVHNSMYERPVSLQELGYEVPLEMMDDTLAMARLLLGGNTGAGLKPQSQKNLGYPDWETDSYEYLNYANYFCSMISKNFDKDKYSTLESTLDLDIELVWYSEYLNAIDNIKDICYKYYTVEETENILQLLFEKGCEYRDNNIEVPSCLPYSYIPYKLLCKYGACDSIATRDLYDFFNEQMTKLSNDKVNLHEGYKVILKQMYAGYVLEKNGFYWDDDNIKNIVSDWKKTDIEALRRLILNPVVKNYIVDTNKNKYLAKIFSLYYPEYARARGFSFGVYNENTRKCSIQKYNSKSEKFLRATKADLDVLSKDLPSNILDTIYDLIVEDVKNATDFEYLQDFYTPESGNNFLNEVMLDDETKVCMMIDSLSKYVLLSNLYNPQYVDLFDLNTASAIITNCHKYSDSLMELSNLETNFDIDWKEKGVRKRQIERSMQNYLYILLQNDRIRNMIVNNADITDPIPEDLTPFSNRLVNSVSLSYKQKRTIQSISDMFRLDELDLEYYRLAEQIVNVRALKDTYGDKWLKARKEAFENFKMLYEVAKPHSLKLLNQLEDAIKDVYSEDTKTRQLKVGKVDPEKLPELFNVLQYTGIDGDDETTYTDKFRWLVDFRMVKKINKLISTYVDGTIGKDSVSVVDKNSLENDYFTIRTSGYKEHITQDKDYILASSFGVCFTGDTELYSVDGNSYKLKDLVDNNVDYFYGLSSLSDGTIINSVVTNFHKTKTVTRLAFVTLSNNNIVKCTPDHRFMLRDGSYKEAQELNTNELLMSFGNTTFSVLKVEIKDVDPTDVYDFTVPEYENALLSCGVFVHNCTADSLRWKSKMHTIPGGSQVKKFYTSRFEGGTLIMPDYSAMEVRALAGTCNCKKMYEILKDPDADFHKMTASMIFKKPINEITKDERKFSKSATFAINYGQDVKAFAQNYCNGDIDQANQIYDGFFGAYPEVKQFIEDKHKEYLETGKVSTMTNSFIVIEEDIEHPKKGRNANLRVAQNAPIQSASSCIAGCVVYELCDYVKKENLKSKPMCFIHDSIEVDVHPYELIKVISVFKQKLYEIPNVQYGLPSKADFALGKSLGHEIELKVWEPNKELTKAHLVLEGNSDEIEETLEVWKKVYKVTINRIYHEDKEGNKIDGWSEGSKMPISELFGFKKTYNSYINRIKPGSGIADITIEYPDDYLNRY